MARTAKITNANVGPLKNVRGAVGNTPVRAQDFNTLIGDHVSQSDSVAQKLGDAGVQIKHTAAAQVGGTDVIFGKNGTSVATADPYTESASQLFPLGTELIYGDRVYRYAQAGGVALTPGTVLQSKVAVGAHHTSCNMTDTVASGSYTVSIETAGDTDITLNQYAEGFLWITDGTGEGQCMKIKSNPAHDHSVDESIVFTLYDPVVTALAAGASSEATIQENPFKAVVIAPHAETGDVIGVAPRAVQANYYFWAQVKGPCAVLASGTLVIGGPAYRALATANGAVLAGDLSDANPALGRVIQIGANGEYALIWLTIE